ncbi:MAG: TIGR03013 family XrtA/PEP-CTERM system glycosyltransferase [Nitrospiria bacterium]
MLKIFSRYIPIRSLFLWGTEGLVIVSVIWAAFAWRWSVPQPGEAAWSDMLSAMSLGLLCQLSLYYHDLYLGAGSPSWKSVVKILQSIAIAFLIAAALSMVVPQWRVGGKVMGALLILPLALVGWRLACAKLLGAHAFERRILLVGAGSLADDVEMALASQSDPVYTIAVRLPEWPSADAGASFACLEGLAEGSGIDRVVIAVGDRRGKLPINELLRCRFSGVAIEDGVSFYERLTGKVHLDALKPSWLIFSDGFPRSGLAARGKRAFDLIASIVGLLALTPLTLLIALLIKLDSPGPVLYRQERVGRGERPFTLYKFRSMRQDAERSTGPVWAKERDDRVTRVGKWLRLLRLDELPQLINVVRGEMSIVGPRPERPCFVDYLKTHIPYYGLRHAVKPGITGWAQVRYRYGSSVADTIEKLQYDLCYIKNQSLTLDATILMDTVKIMLLGSGAR